MNDLPVGPADSPETFLSAQQAAERIQLALESGAIIGTWAWDVAPDRFTGDAGCARLFGLTPDNFAAVPMHTILAAIEPDDYPDIHRMTNTVISEGGRYNAEYRVLQPGGSFRWVQSSGRCYKDRAGTPVRFAGVLIDIDERKRAEHRLRQSEAEAREASRLLRAVIESVPALIYVKDRGGRMQVANGPVMDLIGKPWAEVELRTDAELFDHSAQSIAIMETDRRLMDAGGTEELEEIIGYDQDGARIWLSHKTAFRDAEGNVVGLVGTSVDISARKRAEQALSASEAQLRRVLDNLFAFVGITDLHGNLLEANRAPLEGAGLTRDDVIGRPLWEAYWWSHDPDVRDKIKDSVERARRGEITRADLPVRWRDDTRIMIDFQIAPLRNEQGDVIQLIPSGVDVTARTQAEAQRETLILELNHRVKNLFAIACGMVSVTARTAATPRDMAKSLIGRLNALARAHELINPAVIDDALGQSVALEDLVVAVLTPHLVPGGDQLHCAGSPVQAVHTTATGLALIFHELATNSAKYGALSVPEGQLSITWQMQSDALLLTWRESGGPPIAEPPAREGFGSHLARTTAAGQLGGDISFTWAETGLRVALTVKADRLHR